MKQSYNLLLILQDNTDRVKVNTDMHVATDEGSSDVEIVGVYMPSACCVKKVKHEVSLLSDGILGVIVHVNVCE